jgi:hypothetical protein
VKPSIEVVVKIADTLEVSLDYLVGKTKLELDAAAIQRLEDISALSEENIFNLVDMALRDLKTKKAYAK